MNGAIRQEEEDLPQVCPGRAREALVNNEDGSIGGWERVEEAAGEKDEEEQKQEEEAEGEEEMVEGRGGQEEEEPE